MVSISRVLSTLMRRYSFEEAGNILVGARIESASVRTDVGSLITGFEDGCFHLDNERVFGVDNFDSYEVPEHCLEILTTSARA